MAHIIMKHANKIYMNFQLRRVLRRRFSDIASESMVYSAEVKEAMSGNKPIVALESTIITHGMPYPQNLETALEVENIIKSRGATPATVAILSGVVNIGLNEDQITYLAKAKDVVKTSRRDLAPVIAQQLDGATTVAGTIIAAKLADIPVFVTGGIGGVHREGEDTLDISADLTELGRSSTMVVCSGVKSILDIGRTLEYLETQGVCVCSFGTSRDFPSFYSMKSGYQAPYNIPTALEAARLIQASKSLQLNSGILLGVPIPKEHAMDENVINEAINKALEQAKKQNIHGKKVTPFILSAVAKVTSGASLSANIALIKENAKVGADVAVELSKLRHHNNPKNTCGFIITRSFHSWSKDTHYNLNKNSFEANDSSLKSMDPKKPVLFIGGANVDRTYRITEKSIQLDGSTHACSTSWCAGGVARNMAAALWLMRGRTGVTLLTAVGDDHEGQLLNSLTPGLILDGCVVKGKRTAQYAAVLDSNGECSMGLGDMDVHANITKEMVDNHMDLLEECSLAVLDGNPPQPTIDHVLSVCQLLKKPVFFEPTDKRKAVKGLEAKTRITYSSPNLNELRAMAHYLHPNLKIQTETINDVIDLAKIVSNLVDNLIITMGVRGVMVVNKISSNKLSVRLYNLDVILDKIVSVSGAGDCFSAGFINGLISGYDERQCVSWGFEAAKTALLSQNTVPDTFCFDVVKLMQFETLV